MTKTRASFAVLAILSVLFPITFTIHAGRSAAVSVPPIQLEPVLSGLDSPIYVTGARDGSRRLFILERQGRAKVLLPGSAVPSLFLDISDRVGSAGERGMLGLAFHPLFRDNGRFFVSYSRLSDGATSISEFHVSDADRNVAQGDETPLLVIPQPSEIHHAGMLEFGPDGDLYISTGDGEFGDPENSAQDIESLRGKILRIDIDHSDGDNLYVSPESNPYFGLVPGRDEIYALGFRNPWRFSFDRATGQLYVGDVGQDEREEIDLIIPGGNYGWRVFEGTRCTLFEPDACATLGSLPPLLEYEHTAGRCAIIGGPVYRGTRSSLPDGAYLFADFCTGEIFAFNDGAQHLLLGTGLNIDAFGEDDDGEIYVVSIDGSVNRISQIAQEATPLTIDSASVRKRANGKLLDPVVIKANGKKFEMDVHGSGFASGATILIGGTAMETTAGVTSDSELTAMLRTDTLARPGTLTVQVANPDGSHSNILSLIVQK